MYKRANFLLQSNQSVFLKPPFLYLDDVPLPPDATASLHLIMSLRQISKLSTMHSDNCKAHFQAIPKVHAGSFLQVFPPNVFKCQHRTSIKQFPAEDSE